MKTYLNPKTTVIPVQASTVLCLSTTIPPLISSPVLNIPSTSGNAGSAR